MDQLATRSAPARRSWRIVLVGLAILGVTVAASVVQRSLAASAPATSTTTSVPSTSITTSAPSTSLVATVPPSWPAGPGRSTGRQALDEADGVIPDGEAVSVFAEETPAVGNLDPDLLDALQRAATDAEADGVELRVNSGWRSSEYQQRLLRDAVDDYGSEEEAARWVATPETSAHVSGEAVDIGPSAATDWLSEHGAAYGLCQIYGNEPWHYELWLQAVADGCPPMYADPTEDPRMQP